MGERPQGFTERVILELRDFKITVYVLFNIRNQNTAVFKAM